MDDQPYDSKFEEINDDEEDQIEFMQKQIDDRAKQEQILRQKEDDVTSEKEIKLEDSLSGSGNSYLDELAEKAELERIVKMMDQLEHQDATELK